MSDTLTELLSECQRRHNIRQQIAQAKRDVATLSARESEVLACLIGGASNKEIALQLDISPRTVEIHRANAMRKMQAHTTADAVRIGIYAGLIPELSVSAA